MVSKASEDFPLPERPVTTTMTSRGSETVTFFRLWSRAPRTTIWLSAILFSPSRSSLGKYTAPCQRANGYILACPDSIIRPCGFSSVQHLRSYIFRGARQRSIVQRPERTGHDPQGVFPDTGGGTGGPSPRARRRLQARARPLRRGVRGRPAPPP